MENMGIFDYKTERKGFKVKRVAIYIRVSTDKQAKKGDSLAEQMETLTKYVNDHEDMILHDTYVDDGISGQKINRDGFQRLIGDVKAGSIDLIIFTKLDRWFRSLRHYLNTQATLEKYHVEWDAVAQPFYDTTTPQGRAFVAQGLIFAELEAQNDSVRIKDVFDYKYKRGEVLSGKTPIGYNIVDKHLVPNEDAEKVVRIFEHYDKTNSLNDTLRFMEREYGIVMSQDNLKRSILKNTKYIGVMRDNDNFCAPIISRELFDRVQRGLSKNVKRSQKRNYIFSGLMVCGCCGKNLSCFIAGSGKRGKRYVYKKYRCRFHTLGRCENSKTVSENVLERYLLANIDQLLSDYIVSFESKEKVANNNEKKKEALRKKIKKLKDLYLNDLITLDEFREDKESMEKQLLELDKEPKAKDLSGLREFLKGDWKDIYQTLTDVEKRRLWRSVIKEIRLDAEKNIDIIFL